ncbi:MAG: VCBS repeat-containing protein [Planctomycetes bacterium]|nr:VCBS repeat-containing protein [Planctomycetota bacterium]
MIPRAILGPLAILPWALGSAAGADLFVDVTATQFTDLRGGKGAMGNTFLDFDEDGDFDLIDAQASSLRIYAYVNNGTGTFAPAPNNAGIDTGEGTSIIPGDLDGDGDLDFVVGWGWSGGSQVYRNDGGTFSNISSACGVGHPSKFGGSFGDIDGDGDLDLVLGGGGADTIYVNDGTGRFSEQTAARGLVGKLNSHMMLLADFDGDGDLDLMLNNPEVTGMKYYRNDGTGHFQDATAGSGLDIVVRSDAFCPADFDNDGDLDLFQTEVGVYLNDGTGTFANIGATCGIPPDFAFACMCADVDDDGWIDVVLGNDLYRNDGDHTFTAVTNSGIKPTSDGWGSAFADIDGDGDLDLKTEKLLLRNSTDDGRALLVAPRTAAGAPALNAKVWVYRAGHLGDAGHLLAYREVIGATIPLSGSLLEAHVGLPNDATVDVRVLFLSGAVKTLRDVARGQRVIVTEGAAGPRILRVDPRATGANDGSTWADAFAGLRPALEEAREGDEVWVAAGTYVAGPAREDAFRIPAGVALYGGFAGIEETRGGRDPAARVTRLSGDIAFDDDPSEAPGTPDRKAADNAYHVVVVETGATVDGITIEGGNADGAGAAGWGGGLYAGSRATIRRVILRGNSAVRGGGACIAAGASPSFVTCAIVDGYAEEGGGVYAAAGAKPSLVHVTIGGNRASAGSGIFAEAGSAPSLTNSIVWSGGDAPISAAGATVTLSHTLSDEDPLFRGPGDYALGFESPAIDAALGSAAHEIDLAGRAVPCGEGPDMGAYESCEPGDFFLRIAKTSEAHPEVDVEIVLDFDHNADTPPPGPIDGWSYGICHDPAALEPIGVSFAGGDTGSLNGGAGPDFAAARLPAQLPEGASNGVVVAVVIDTMVPLEPLEPRNDWRDARILYRIIATPRPCHTTPGGTTTEIRACDTLGRPPVETVMTIRGDSVLLDGQEPATVALPCEVTFLRGNVNGQGNVDIGDAVKIIYFLFADEPVSCERAADVNDDANLNIADPIALLNYLFASGPRPNDPFDACGTDPTPDALSCASFPLCE